MLVLNIILTSYIIVANLSNLYLYYNLPSIIIQNVIEKYKALLFEEIWIRSIIFIILSFILNLSVRWSQNIRKYVEVLILIIFTLALFTQGTSIVRMTNIFGEKIPTEIV